jgi:hypothetical protein
MSFDRHHTRDDVDSSASDLARNDEPGHRSAAAGLEEREGPYHRGSLFGGSREAEDALDSEDEAAAKAEALLPADEEEVIAASPPNPQSQEQREGSGAEGTNGIEAPPVYQIKREYKDGNFGATAAYEVSVTSSEVRAVVGLRLKPGKKLKAREVRDVKNRAVKSFKKYFDRRFQLRDALGRSRPLRMAINFSHPTPHHEITLRRGYDRGNATNWYTGMDSMTYAHETGHLIGLLDEYVDPKSPDRTVYRDHSLMGDYYTEGMKKAKLKPRHGRVFAQDISAATGMQFHL